MTEKLNAALKQVSAPVLYLGTKICGKVEKFSVVSPSGHQFVHIFKSNINDDVFIKCCSGLCQSKYAKKKI